MVTRLLHMKCANLIKTAAQPSQSVAGALSVTFVWWPQGSGSTSQVQQQAGFTPIRLLVTKITGRLSPCFMFTMLVDNSCSPNVQSTYLTTMCICLSPQSLQIHPGISGHEQVPAVSLASNQEQQAEELCQATGRLLWLVLAVPFVKSKGNHWINTYMNKNNNKEMVTRGFVWKQAWFRVHWWICVTHTGQRRRSHSCSCCLHYSVALFLCRLIETNKKLIFFTSSISVGNIFVPQVSHSRNVLTFLLLDPMTLYPEIIILSQINSVWTVMETPDVCFHAHEVDVR